MPADLTVGQFVYVIRKRIKLSPDKAIFIFVNELLPPTAALMSSVYEEHKDEDGYVVSFVSIYAPDHAEDNMLMIAIAGSCTSPTRARTRLEISRSSEAFSAATSLFLDDDFLGNFTGVYWVGSE